MYNWVFKEKIDYNGDDRINPSVDLIESHEKLPVGRIKNGEEDVSDGENVEDEGECQHRDEDGWGDAGGVEKGRDGGLVCHVQGHRL
jgi:hypothetical protein